MPEKIKDEQYVIPEQPKLAPKDEAAPGTPGTGENTCPTCHGTGRLERRACPDCDGSGFIVQGIGGA